MRARVSEQGVVIPKRMLPDVEEVEIRTVNGTVLVLPVRREDPILDLGSDPVKYGALDASERHDKLLTTGAEIVAYWEREHLLGTLGEITDSVEHACQLRQQAERRFGS